jgi:hypothetical protein
MQPQEGQIGREEGAVNPPPFLSEDEKNMNPRKALELKLNMMKNDLEKNKNSNSGYTEALRETIKKLEEELLSSETTGSIS